MADSRRRREPQPAMLGVVALGGGLGGLARHGLALGLPAERVPWGTLAANLLGCILIGVLMVLITEAWSAHRLLRPFLGVGVLGGFTTFSTYAVEVDGLLATGGPLTALAYLIGTPVTCVTATVGAVVLTRILTGTGP